MQNLLANLDGDDYSKNLYNKITGKDRGYVEIKNKVNTLTNINLEERLTQLYV